MACWKDGDYILFVAQEDGSDTRSMLIAAQKFYKTRADQYLIMKEHCTKDVLVPYEQKQYTVDQLLPQVFEKVQENKYLQVIKPYTYICNLLSQYAWGIDEDRVRKMDREWYKHSPINLCTGTNYVENYLLLKQMTNYNGISINIVDSFLYMGYPIN
jgi:hypothetical protein